MRYILIIAFVSFSLFQCKGPDKDSIPYLDNISDPIEKNNVKILNEIIQDTKLEAKFISDNFYVMEEHVIDRGIDLYSDQMQSIVKQNREADVNFVFQPGNIKYYDTLTKKYKPSVIIKTKEERYNKVILTISRPYRLNDSEVILFFFGTIQNFTRERPGVAAGSIWVNRYKKNNEKWSVVNSVSLGDF